MPDPGFPNRKVSTQDIRWIHTHNPVVVGTNVVDTTEVAIYAAGATLHAGVRVKNLDDDVIYVGHTGGDTVYHGVSGAYRLGQDEEVFIECRNIDKVTVKGSAVSSMYTFIAH